MASRTLYVYLMNENERYSHRHEGRHLREVVILSQDGEWAEVRGVKNPNLKYDVKLEDLHRI